MSRIEAMSANGNRSKGVVRDGRVQPRASIKPEPVDEEDYTSLLSQTPAFDDNTSVKIEPGSDQDTFQAGQLTARDCQDAEPICSSELATKPKKRAQPKIKLEAPATPVDGPTFYDLTEAEREAQSWAMLDEINEAAKTSRMAKLEQSLRIDGTDRLISGSKRKRSALETKTTRELNEEKRLRIDGTERLGAINPFYKKADFATRIRRTPKSEKSTSQSRTRSGAIPSQDSIYHPAVQGSAHSGARRSEKTVDQRLERVVGTHDSPRVDKSVRGKKAPAAADRHDIEKSVRKSVKNESNEVQGEKEVNAVHKKKARWCLCQKKKAGKIICCDNDACDIKWFHIDCLGTVKETEGEWFCQRCTTLANKKNTKERAPSASSKLLSRHRPTWGSSSSSVSSAWYGSRARSASRTRSGTAGGNAYQRTTTVLSKLPEEEAMDN